MQVKSWQKEYAFGNTAPTVFSRDHETVRLRRLGGMDCDLPGPEAGQMHDHRFFTITTEQGPVPSGQLQLARARFTRHLVQLAWHTTDGRLALHSRWTHDKATGIWRRQDRIENVSGRALTLYRCLSLFTLAPGHYALYSQASRWCAENQGGWQDLEHGTWTLGGEGGRTTQGGTPYACVLHRDTGRTLAFHLLPRGNWVLRFRIRTHANLQPSLAIEAGLADGDLRLQLKAGDAFAFPEILVQSLPDRRPESGAVPLHRFLLNHEFRGAKKSAPVVYNTWFDAFDQLSPARLLNQLKAAKAIGCEVFTIDAGWFGRDPDRVWHKQIGDWREAGTRAFRGRMSAFAERVRAAGLGFGLWMEPERICQDSPILARHPEWFLPVPASGCWYPDLQKSGARQWVTKEIARVIETYGLRWLKIDFNAEIGPDPHGLNLAGYYTRWFELLDGLRARFPQVFFEGCASGGLRLDIESLRHNDGHFLTDTAEPVDVLRIWQGALLRLPPGRFTRWCVLRDAGRAVCPFGFAPGNEPHTILAPATAPWDVSVSVQPDFAVLCALPGILGFSGDLAGLNQDLQSRLAAYVRFYKRWRTFLIGSVAHPITPVHPMENRSGWIAVQLRPPNASDSLVFAYRLNAASSCILLPLVGMRPDAQYSIERYDRAERTPLVRGRDLTEAGLSVVLEHPLSAAVLSVRETRRPAKKSRYSKGEGEPLPLKRRRLRP